LTVAQRLRDAGCQVIMPWAAPIGSARGLVNRDALNLLRARLPEVTLVVDAGLGAPSHAAEALEFGYDAVLLNTAVAKAADPVGMARAFRLAVEAGRLAFESGLMGPRDFASPSTPVVGTPFWHAVS
jgi:thiazole synthase